jgi:hypothetical protein
MDYRETLNILASLTKDQSFVLYRKLKGDKHLVIGNKMGVSADRVQQHSSAIFEKFRLGGRDMEGLRSTTQAIMFDVAIDSNWERWAWPTPKLLEKLSSPEQPIAQPASVTWQELEDHVSTDWQDTIRRIALDPRAQIGAFAFIILVIIIFVVTRPRSPSLSAIPSHTATFEASQTLAVAPVDVVFTPTLTPSPTVTMTPTVNLTKEPTLTPGPTSTATITNTPWPSPTPEKIYIFHEFKDGFGPFEAAVPEKATIVDGSFTGGSWLSIPCDLKNFQIEVKGYSSGTGTGTGIFISPAYIDPLNNILFRTNYHDREWRHRENSPSGFQMSNMLFNNFDYEMTIVMKVIDLNVDVTINTTLISSVYNNKVGFGRIGFYTYYASIKSIKIVELP